jgi:hypothetical protein
MMAWHYTVGVNATEILREGFIRGATAGLPPGERPTVWFSMRQIWEPAASRRKLVAGGESTMTMAEMIEEYHGLWRFGVPKAALHAWTFLRRKAAMSHDTELALIRVAARAGFNPRFWYGALEPIAVNQCEVQYILARGDGWRRLAAVS